MITNNATEKMVIQGVTPSYSMVYILHSIYRDYDVVGRTFWLTAGGTTTRRDVSDISINYALLNALQENTTYTLRGAFYDAMVDSELLAAIKEMNISDVQEFTTREKPRITNITVTAQPVDVGVGSPVVNVETTGFADYCVLEFQQVGSTDWVRYYTGALSDTISMAGVPIGIYNVRIAGFITLPDGSSVDSSGWNVYGSAIQIAYNFIPPSAPTDVQFRVARIQDGNERFDVRVEWTWDKGTGANVREFVVYYVDEDTFDVSGWTKSQKINVGSAKAATITSFPYKKTYVFKIAAVAWGPDSQAITDTVANFEFTIDENTVFDSSFTNETGVEVNYSGITGKILVDGSWQQSFLIDAATGAISVGILDEEGKAPISFDPTNRTVNVDGKVITKSIYAANFIMTNLDGTDNPAIYSQGKTWGDANSGIWMGIDNATLKPKFDLGNSTQYIRYDGDTLRISGEVIIGTPYGDIDVSTGLQGRQTVFIYRIWATSVPATPVGTAYPPDNWVTVPPTRTSSSQNIYVSTGLLNPVTNELVEGTSWSTPTQWSGTSGTSGEDAKSFSISSTSQSFSYSGTGTLKTSGSIVITGSKTNITDSITWVARNQDSALVSLSINGDTATLTSDSFGSSTYVTITATCGGFTEVTTIVRLVDGSSILSAYLSNETVALPADSSGVVSSYSTATGQMQVFFGLVNITNECTFTVGTRSNTLGTISTLGVYQVSSLTADSGYIDLIATHATLGTITKRFSLTVSKTGTSGSTGTAAISVDLSSTSQSFSYTGAGVLKSESSILFTVNRQNTTASVTWNAVNSLGQSVILASVTDAGATLNASQFQSNSANTFVTVTVTCDGISDSITIVKLVDGSSVLSGYLTNEAVILPANVDGFIQSYTVATGAFRVYYGTTEVTSGCTFSIIGNSNVPSSTISTGGAYAITGMTAGVDVATGYVDLMATHATYGSITKRITVTKSFAGKGYNIVYTSDFSNGSVGSWGSNTDIVTVTDGGTYGITKALRCYRRDTNELLNYVRVTPGQQFRLTAILNTLNSTNSCFIGFRAFSEDFSTWTWLTVAGRGAGLSGWAQIEGTVTIPEGRFWVLPWIQRNGTDGTTYGYNLIGYIAMEDLSMAGESGSSVYVQWSSDATSWHDTFVTGDIYMRQQVNGVWSSAIRAVGEDGAAGATGNYTALIYRAATTQPATPTGNSPTSWLDAPPTSGIVWMSRGVKDGSTGNLVGTWSTPVRLTGADGASVTGATGTRGVGIYTQSIASLTAFNTTSATSFFTTNFGSGPVTGDVLTQYRTGTPSIAFTRYWNGSAWTTAELVVHGDMIVTGTIPAAKIISASITAAQIADATITAAKIANATITSAKIADAAITRAKISDTLQSDNYVANTSGMLINFATGTINLNSTGSGGRMSITNDRIDIYDSAGTLRVRIGRLN